MNTSASISVVIPVLNEIDALPENLRALHLDPSVAQVVVVDGGSTDGSREHAEGCVGGKIELVTSEPGRGSQMNAGARQATGDWLVFHHADSRLPAPVGEHIDAAVAAGAVWGGFSHRFSDSNWKLRMISRLHNYRCRKSGVIYGDQSMFVRGSFFWSLGGFALIGLEDLLFSDHALGQCRSHLLEVEVVTDSRKFRQMGELRALLHVVSIVVRYERDRKIGNEPFFRPYR